MFPFLIGKVLTLLRILNPEIEILRAFKFPFLIGKVLTIPVSIKDFTSFGGDGFHSL